MTLHSITLTGVDETTNLDRLAAITRAANGVYVEWGILYSPERAGRGGRYPSLAHIRALSQFAIANELRAAIHVCGRGVDELLSDSKTALELTAGFSRVQLNFNQEKRRFVPDRLDTLICALKRPVITQHNAANDRVTRLITAPHHHVLVDASGGRGISPSSWPPPIAGKPTGYAGGLGPDNLAGELTKIAAIAGPHCRGCWVDMESKLFNADGCFDASRAELAIRIVQAQVGWLSPGAEVLPSSDRM